MKLLKNRAVITILMVFIFMFSCKTERKSKEDTNIVNDTIVTESGLKYYYLTKGTGRKIEPGSKTSAMLSLKVKDSVIWTTYSSKDSVFSHIAGRGGVIKGYDEMALLMREGDNVVAILPSDLAYGERGSGETIPPNSILVYDQFKITAVTEPRFVLSDTLFFTLKKDGVLKMTNKYNHITSTQDSILYHRGIDQINGLWRKLNREKMFAEAFDAFSFFSKSSDDIRLHFYVIRSLENLGKFKQAIDQVDLVLKGKLTTDQKEYYLKYRQDLVNSLEKK